MSSAAADRTRIFLSGCNGRMGRQISQICGESADLEIVAGYDLLTDSPYGYPVYSDPALSSEEFDCLIDFSNPAALSRLISFIEKRRCPAVICTTGLDESLKQDLARLSGLSPVFISANMSLGINILADLARRSAKLLYPDFDIEIIEAHHNQKLDAPSGTAMLLADQINQELDSGMEYVFDRSQTRKKRQKNEIGLHAIRGGNIVGEHTVLFAGPEENLTLAHSAASRAVFARGALAAARFLKNKEAGSYSMRDLVNTITASR